MPRLRTSSWAAELRELRAAGDDAPEWIWCRATLRQAFRAAFLDRPEQLRAAAVEVVAATYPHDEADDTALADMVATAMAADELVRDRVLFDCRALLTYLLQRASDELKAHMPSVLAWAVTTQSVYRLEAIELDRLRVTDLVTEEEHTVLHIGAAVGLGTGECVLGRIAPIAAEPGAMFVSRPLHIDETSAVELAEGWQSDDEDDAFFAEYDESGAYDESDHEPVGRRDPLTALGDAIAAGRMPAACTLGAGAMSLGSDLQPHPEDFEQPTSEPSPRVRELMESGLSFMDAQHVGVVEMALTIARVAPDGLPVAALHAAIALSHQGVRDAVRARGSADDAPRWKAISRCVQEPVRGFCLEMASRTAA